MTFAPAGRRSKSDSEARENKGEPLWDLKEDRLAEQEGCGLISRGENSFHLCQLRGMARANKGESRGAASRLFKKDPAEQKRCGLISRGEISLNLSEVGGVARAIKGKAEEPPPSFLKEGLPRRKGPKLITVIENIE